MYNGRIFYSIGLITMKIIYQWIAQNIILFLTADERNRLKIKNFVLAVNEDDRQSAEEQRKCIGLFVLNFNSIFAINRV
jgi:hypothetical protein